MDLTISTLTLESFLLVVVRTGAFTSVAPLFGHRSGKNMNTHWLCFMKPQSRKEP